MERPAILTDPRAHRERAASEEGDVYRRNGELHDRFRHVFDCPNSARAWRRFHEFLVAVGAGRHVLEIGCGDGALGRMLVRRGAASVQGLDISETVVSGARRAAHGDPRLSYEVADAMSANGGRVDVVVGSAILHHLDWRSLLVRIYEHRLNPGGSMFFYEPLGENAALQFYWRFFPNAHTADERPFKRADIAWLESAFARFEFYPTN